MLVETYRSVADHLYDHYWPEWRKVTRHVLLVGDKHEYLFGGQYADSTFQDNCNGILSRPATMNKYFLATFPYINYQPTIIIGTPENTQKTPLDWTVTLLHEHFHQLQFSHPDYATAQQALDLDKGDQTGMWMLNHPFPYEDDLAIEKMDEMAQNLPILSQSVSSEQVLIRHKKIKSALKTILGEEHYRYLNLQLWQEGFARFMELSTLGHWITNFDDIDQDRFEKQALIDYLKAYQSSMLEGLKTSRINKQKRVYFYALGAAEALLIETVNADWKSDYFDELFSTDHMLIN